MKHIIKILNERIKYYSEGEEMKSLSESICDSRIVEELKDIKERIENLDIWDHLEKI